MAKQVLCPVDGSTHAATALRHGAELATLTGAHLTICAVNLVIAGGRGPAVNQWSESEVQAILAQAESEARAAGAKDVRTTSLISLNAASAIISLAEELGADQIVIGTGDKRGLKRLVLGSVAAEVASRAGCTVTVAR